jgi:LytR cell envelope-related transcriptional attenuator
VGWKTPVTLLVLLGVLLGAAYYGYHTVISPATGDDTSTNPPGKKCTKQRVFHRGQTIRSKDVLVNVYNAGSIAGLAGNTLDALHHNGFLRGVAENAPAGIGATNVTIVTRHPRLPQVKLVANQFKGHVALRRGRPLAAGIDVVVGDRFVGVNRKALKRLRLHHVVRTCTHIAHTAG